MGWSFKNIASVASAPFTGGASLLGLTGGETADTGSAVLGGGMLGTTALSTASSLMDNIYNNYASRKATKAQNEWNLAQWERENAYNHPSEIMKRYQEAGLNPNLIYGQAYESPAHLESAKQQHIPLDSMHNLLAMYNLEAQNQLLQAQKEEVNARTNLIKTQDSNWTTDHTNFTKEIIDMVSGLLGSSPDSRVGRQIGVYIHKAIEESQDSGKGSSLLDFDGRPMWLVKHEGRRKFYEKYGYFPNW